MLISVRLSIFALIGPPATSRRKDAIAAWQYASNLNLIKPVMHIARRCKVAHCSFERSMPHPVLHRADIEASPEHARGIRRTKGLQIKLRLIKLRALCDRLA